MACECINFCIAEPGSRGHHHHKNCPKYKTEKNAYLFCLDEAVNAFVPAAKGIENTIDVADMCDGERVEIIFKRADMTDQEFDAIPDV